MSSPCASAREDDAAHPLLLQLLEQALLTLGASIQRLSIEYDGWWISSGVPSSRAMVAASRVFSAE